MYFSTQELEARGWTKSLIKKFLPEPHDIKYFRNGCQYFYWQITVGDIEASEEFKRLQEKALRRRAAGIAATEKRKLEYLDYLKNKMPIRVRVVPADQLLVEAIDSYNAHRLYRWERRQYDPEYYSVPASKNSGEEFLQRIQVNYIRHRLTSYENLLYEQRGKLGKAEALEIIQRRIFHAIIENYPELKLECERQMIHRGLLQVFTAEENGQLRLFA